MGERISSDLMGPFSQTEIGFSYIMVVVDYFSMYYIAVPIKEITAGSVAQALLERWAGYFCIPLELHSDQGSQYCGSVMMELCKLLGIARTAILL